MVTLTLATSFAPDSRSAGSRSPLPSTPRMASIAWSIRSATSRLTVSSLRARAAVLIEFAGQPRAIGVERAWTWPISACSPRSALAPAFDGRTSSTLERARQASARNFNQIGFARTPIRISHWAQNLCDDKAL